MLQSFWRRPVIMIAASEAPVSHILPVGALDQLFDSFTLLTSPVEEEEAEAMLQLEELDELMSFPELQQWLALMGAAET